MTVQRLDLDPQLPAERGEQAFRGGQARQPVAAFDPGDGRLTEPGPSGQRLLGEACLFVLSPLLSEPGATHREWVSGEGVPGTGGADG
ncbi:hypothetical protein [Micromonospora aurantiaca]|uniref:hypothetical protein n=1 Tax=Micromonospora aurantiaca (nom. illeg.) TaxID=47850 RepID=UPI0034520D49